MSSVKRFRLSITKKLPPNCFNDSSAEISDNLSLPYILKSPPTSVPSSKPRKLVSFLLAYKLKSVTESDIFALIPIKKNINMAPGEGIVEFSGPIQKNERTYYKKKY